MSTLGTHPEELRQGLKETFVRLCVTVFTVTDAWKQPSVQPQIAGPAGEPQTATACVSVGFQKEGHSDARCDMTNLEGVMLRGESWSPRTDAGGLRSPEVPGVVASVQRRVVGARLGEGSVPGDGVCVGRWEVLQVEQLPTV